MAGSNFDQADSTTVGPGSFLEIAFDWETLSNQLHLVSVGHTGQLVLDVDVGSADMYCQIDVSDLILSSSLYVGPAVRCDNVANTCYYFAVGKNSSHTSGYWQFNRVVSGTIVALGSQTGFTHTPGITARLEVSGTTLSGYLGGSLVGTHTDSTIVTGSRGGVRGTRANSSDDFHADNMLTDALSTTVSSGKAFPFRPRTRFAPFSPGSTARHR